MSRSQRSGTPQSRRGRPQGRSKVAVDRTAEEYWAEYFGPYGSQLTKDVPRRIAAGLVTAMKRRAAKGDTPPQLKVSRVEVRPQGRAPAVRKDARGNVSELVTEGQFRGVIEAGGQRTVVRRWFCATLDPRGQLTSLESVAVG